MSSSPQAIHQSLDALLRWVEDHDYQAYDPGDGDLSFLRYLTCNTHFLKRVLTAAVLRTPFHIRPWIGIRPHRSTKGTGYMAWGYVKLYAVTGEERYRLGAEACFEWLISNRTPNCPHFCWGNHFDFSTRGGTMKRYTPTIVWSGLIGQAFLEGYAVLGHAKYLEVAASIAAWIGTLPREETGSGVCLSYIPDRQSSIHNSNMLGAALLARVSHYTQDTQARDLAREAMRYSCTRQNPDGDWYYGADPKYHWIDSFHTGYNLDSLKRYNDSTGDPSFLPYATLGYQYFKAHFFEADGRVKYYDNRTQPIDIQCIAQAIDTLAYNSAEDPAALELAQKVAGWALAHMQDADGHFYYRDLGWMRIKTPMYHWGQATMFKALSHLLSRLVPSQQPPPSPARTNGRERAGVR